VHGGLLALRDDARARRGDGGARDRAIDLLVVNLYPFEATVARGRGL
jgi:phosphoribosylaminoimidazolecarboxamide formyltransferase/IMP cyclohydrolase